MARPVLLRAPMLERHEPVRAFDVLATLWGRRALGREQLVAAALEQMAISGLLADGRPTAFATEHIDATPILPLAEWIGTLTGAPPALLVRFDTPVLPTSGGALSRDDWYEPFASAAHELVAWDLEDRELGESVDRDSRRLQADETRAAAAAVLGSLAVQVSGHSVDVGKRRARSNPGSYDIKGWLGTIEVEGDLASAWPWLSVAALGSCGQRRSAGFGAVSLWLSA